VGPDEVTRTVSALALSLITPVHSFLHWLLHGRVVVETNVELPWSLRGGRIFVPLGADFPAICKARSVIIVL